MTLFADLDLARRLEDADAWFKVAYAEAQATLDPAIGATSEAVGGGYAAYVGSRSPLSRAVGLGMHGPVSADEMQQVERFFHTRDAVARVDLCPLANLSLVTWLNAHGYQLADFKNVWVLPLSDANTFPLPESLTVRPADGSEEGLWVQTVSQGFTGQETLAPEDLSIARPTFQMSTVTPFLAWLDGEPAGGAAMATYQGLAAFFSASTRPAFRGRGVQTALLHARLAAAVAAGCDLVTVQTTPGSDSQRNVERLDFRLAYTKPTLVRAAE